MKERWTDRWTEVEREARERDAHHTGYRHPSELHRVAAILGPHSRVCGCVHSQSTSSADAAAGTAPLPPLRLATGLETNGGVGAGHDVHVVRREKAVHHGVVAVTEILAGGRAAAGASEKPRVLDGARGG